MKQHGAFSDEMVQPIAAFALFFSCNLISASDSALDAASKGRKAFELCASCHTLEKGGPDGIGPESTQHFWQENGAAPNFPYSKSLREREGVWDEDALNRYIARPKLAVPGNKWPFRG